MDAVDYLLPASKGRLTIEDGDLGVIPGRRPFDGRTLRQNEANLALCAAAIIRRNIIPGSAVGRKGPGHWRHDDPIFQC